MTPSKFMKHLAVAAGLSAFTAGPSLAQQMYIYPQEGQSQEQQNKDRGECEGWARNQTGYDPMVQGGSTGGSVGGAAVGGAARGALAGAAIGAIAGDAGKGAAIGAAGGGLMGGTRRNRSNQQQASNQQAGRDNYNRAFKGCMEGKKYTVN